MEVGIPAIPSRYLDNLQEVVKLTLMAFLLVMLIFDLVIRCLSEDTVKQFPDICERTVAIKFFPYSVFAMLSMVCFVCARGRSCSIQHARARDRSGGIQQDFGIRAHMHANDPGSNASLDCNIRCHLLRARDQSGRVQQQDFGIPAHMHAHDPGSSALLDCNIRSRPNDE